MYALNDKSRRGKAELTGKSIINAQQSKNVYGEPNVVMTMNAAGTSTWAFMTEKCAEDNRSIAVMLDNLVYSAPTVNEPILVGKSEITLGNKNNAVAEARDLAGLLNVGSLPARCIILGEWEYEDYVSESFLRSYHYPTLAVTLGYLRGLETPALRLEDMRAMITLQVLI